MVSILSEDCTVPRTAHELTSVPHFSVQLPSTGRKSILSPPSLLATFLFCLLNQSSTPSSLRKHCKWAISARTNRERASPRLSFKTNLLSGEKSLWCFCKAPLEHNSPNTQPVGQQGHCSQLNTRALGKLRMF